MVQPFAQSYTADLGKYIINQVLTMQDEKDGVSSNYSNNGILLTNGMNYTSITADGIDTENLKVNIIQCKYLDDISNNISLMKNDIMN